ncbi:MAG TPA: hypothetical protein VGO22_09815 [Pseudorhizobium sp.]|nr:hypothetical protein [Pseudorhizobium sp.]
MPAITDFLPDIAIAPNYFGLFVPADAPGEVLSMRQGNLRIAEQLLLQIGVDDPGALLLNALEKSSLSSTIENCGASDRTRPVRGLRG